VKSVRWALLSAIGFIAVIGTIAFATGQTASGSANVGQQAALAPGSTADSADKQALQIIAAESEARFVIDEVLAGSPKTVVGATHEISGHVNIDPQGADEASGVIVIDARTFSTDSSQRDRAIQSFVLKTNQHEVVRFTPTRLTGLDSAVIGETVPMTIGGNLTIGGVERPVNFDALVTRETPGRVSGNASTVIRYAEWGIAIPQVPLVSSVADNVRLEIHFSAAAA
jgi:polyisoprenoid-binding protein YceI